MRFKKTFPFSAIVGQEKMKMALILNVINPRIGGVLITGPSGTGKSTAVRGLSDLLPQIPVVDGCPFNCAPWPEEELCPLCLERLAAGKGLIVKERPIRIVNLPLNATEDRVAGSLDVARALREGVKALQPGLLAEANRGILYVDEINLLDDHLVNLLLDAAAMGVNYVEREGLSVAHPARFILVGTMNPEEGELRPQIADRIGLQVKVEALTDAEQRTEVLRRWEEFSYNPERFVARYETIQRELSSRIQAARNLLPRVRIGERTLRIIARTGLKMGIRSHRADISMLETARALAAWRNREEVGLEEVVDAAELVLGHRLPRSAYGVAEREIDRREIEHVVGDLEADIDAQKKRL